MAAPHDSQLQLTVEQMRDAGYRTVDMLVRHLTDEGAPPLRRATPGEMRERLGGPTLGERLHAIARSRLHSR